MHRLIILTLFIIVSFTWGTTWMAMKITVHTIPPLFATGMRFLLASPILIAISSITKSPLLFPIKHRLFQIFIIFFYFIIPFTLMLYAGTCVTAGLASLLFSTMPVIVLIFSLLFLKEKIMSFQILGLVIFFIALLYLLYIKCSLNNFNQIKGIFAIILAVLSHAYIYIQCKKRCVNLSVLTFNTLPSLIAGVLITIIAYFFENISFQNFSIQSVLALFYLSNFSGIFGILSYFYLQKQVKAFHASIVFLIFPIITISLEHYFYKYKISICELSTIMFLILGILITLLPQNILVKGKLKQQK